MPRQRFKLLLIGSIVSITVLVMLLLSIIIFNTPADLEVKSKAPLGASVSQVNVAATATSRVLATSTLSDVIIVTPNVPIDKLVSLPSQMTLRRTDAPPLISLDEARKAVYNRGIIWATGGQVNGKTVNLTAAYGLVDLGGRGPTGEWFGSRNIPMTTCDSGGNCTPTGKVLDHYENRPAWILDYGNTYMRVSGPPPEYCKPVACTPPPPNNHSVYVIDAETRAVIEATFYYGT